MTAAAAAPAAGLADCYTETMAPTESGAGAGTRTGSGAGAVRDTGDADRTERARALLVPVDPTGPSVTGVPVAGPVLPGRAEGARPRQVRRPGAEEEPHDGVACPWCGAVNPETRYFCRSCALFLTVADRPVRLPWWRRMVRPGKGRVPMAGERPRVRGLRARWPLWTLRAVAAGAVVTGLLLWTEPAVSAVQDHFTQPVRLHPQAVTASSSDPGHGPEALADGFSDTWWGDGLAGNGAGQYVDAEFGRPVHLLDLMITPGTGTARDSYYQQARPLVLDAVLFHSDGTTTMRRLTLDDTPGPQAFALRGAGVTKVRLILRSAYGASDTTQVAIAELEFFGRSAAASRRQG
ncbi:zinc ribbon domain-containing protein [Kitasatospora sp. NPDC056783]|uniref:NADase-type glycan-binding domain-containing protein n=1 Tax=Kitasatospora sp. NPDC056783 TaxID=3345943 RepID=UPI0036811E7F